MPSISQLQATRNADTRGGWDCFASHRATVSKLLVDAATNSEPVLCVLGAGNCNDLDLKAITQAYKSIDLVDLDGSALSSGVEKQNIDAERLKLHGGLDVTGVSDLLSSWDPASPASSVEVANCMEQSRQHRVSLGRDHFSTVASVCLLSQLLEAVALSMGTEHPQYLEMLTCIRREHIRLLAELSEPGRMIVLVTDIVSSLTLPELDTASPGELRALVGRAIDSKNFFNGMNPAVIMNVLKTDSVLASKLSGVRVTNPWVWDLGPRRYAVCAFTARRV